MGFQHAKQKTHKMAGYAACAASPNTPAHLKAHQQRLAGGKMKLSSAARKKLPKMDFAMPGDAPDSGSYPVPDASHARNALSRVSQFGSPKVKKAVRSKVKAKFPAIKMAKGPGSAIYG